VFTSATEALAQKDELAFDAALLDIRMPGIDGIELCSALAKTHPSALFLLMTAFTSEQRLLDVRASGAQAVLKKPLPVDQLLSLLGSMDAANVLLVEDDPELLESLTEVLAPHGYRVTATASLREARASLSTTTPDVAVIDLKLPDGSGAELARELIASGTTIVLTTGYDGPEVLEAIRSLRSRGARYLGKPFAPALLLELLSQASAPGDAP
jgi:DNA-binding response OmpR family regulator